MIAPDVQGLVGSRCSRCGLHYYPPRSTCLTCHSEEDVTSFTFSGDGTLYSFSTIHVGKGAPMRLGYVDLMEGVRVLARLDLNSDADIGGHVRVEAIGGNSDPTIVRVSTPHEEGK